MRRIAALLAVVALAAAACAEADQASDTTAAPTTQPPATTVAPTTVAPTTAPATTMHDDERAEDEDHGTETTTATGTATRQIEVVMTDFAFEPDEFVVSAGETVLFVIHNEGVIEHEFRLSNTHRIEEHLAAGHDDHDDEGGHHEGGDFIITLAAGETTEAEFTFPDDAALYTEVACLIPGHYEAGMLAPLTVDA